MDIAYECIVRISRHGEFEDSEDFHVEIHEDKTNDDDIVEALMNEIRPLINKDHDGEDDWEDGNMSWELYGWDELRD